ncbi:MAG: trypsin-like peptidase domain-containing protein [Betaproteobacteria bacterium]|nr:trypsin-like peptidase domain-containing protein [Betaproteobacteria bacterium]
MPNPITHYDTLDISRSATPDQINFAYRRALEALAREGKDGTAEAANIRRAWETLANPLSRMSYDASLQKSEPAPRGTEDVLSGGADGLANAKLIKIGIGLVAVLISAFWMRQYAASKLPPKAVEVVAATKAAEATDPGSTPLGVLPRTPDEIYTDVTNSVAKVIVSDFNGNPVSTGSAVVIAPGILITNCHVVKDGRQIQVKFPKETFSASVQTRNEERDLCHLYAGNITARPVPVSSANTLKVGQKVYAIGSPQGLENTLSEGLVSALREVDGGKIIQTSAAVSPGSSGGGLFDTFGNLVGVVTFQARQGQNLNFALPADWIGNVPKVAGGPRIDFSAPAGTVNAEPAAPPEPVAGDYFPGKWTCTGEVEGMTGNWTVTRSSVEISLGDKSKKNSYALQSNNLMLFDPRGNVKLNVDEITDSKLAFSDFNGKKVSCTRR